MCRCRSGLAAQRACPGSSHHPPGAGSEAPAPAGRSPLRSRVSLVPCRSQEPPQDSVIATYEEHEDSVYAVDWSSADPWLFASLSYDGRLVINRVPRALKYHILL